MVRHPFSERITSAMSTVAESPSELHPEGSRRDFLYIMTGAAAVAGTVVAIWPLIDQMNPDASTLAAGGPVDVYLSKLAPGQQIMVMWRGKPVFIVNRSEPALKRLREQQLLAELADPQSQQR